MQLPPVDTVQTKVYAPSEVSPLTLVAGSFGLSNVRMAGVTPTWLHVPVPDDGGVAAITVVSARVQMS